MYERTNPIMEKVLEPVSYVIKKKANYMEKITCGMHAMDNVYKLYSWNEDLVEAGPRLLRFKQESQSCLRHFCFSNLRSYYTVGDLSNKTKMVTKSIRPFKWLCLCNKKKPYTAVFDTRSGFIGSVEIINAFEFIMPC